MSLRRARRFFFCIAMFLVAVGILPASGVAATGVHTTWLWHMHQPIYWPTQSSWTPGRYETAF